MKKTCPCGEVFETKRTTAKFCSERCRKRAQRPGGHAKVVALGVAPVPPPEDRTREPGPLESAALAELAAVDRAATVAGAVVIALARRIDSATADEPGSSLAALSKELRAALAAAVAGAEEADEIDDFRKQRERKQRAR